MGAEVERSSRTKEWGNEMGQAEAERRERGWRVVCKTCHVVIDDCEPFGQSEYVHPTVDRMGAPRLCKNAGKSFSDDSPEVEPFMRKRVRRAGKRATG